MTYSSKRIFASIFILFICEWAIAQNNKLSVWAGYNSSVSSAETLPFWFTHNQSGKYIIQNNTYQLFETGLEGKYMPSPTFSIGYGLDIDVSYSGKLDWRMNQLYFGVGLKWLVFKAGTINDPVLFAGLSTSNGNLARSVNYRPYPKITLATKGYIPFPFMGDHWSFKAEYDEGILTDNRVVARPHLHHKSFFVQYKNFSGWQVELGMDHYVFWGGDSPVYGQLPDGFKDYFRYVTGRPGNESFPATDVNVAGNQLGSYSFIATKNINNKTLKVYLSHPFDDRSGMEFDNLVDNLYGIGFFKDESNEFLEGIVYEFIYTKHQSGAKHIVGDTDEPHQRGRDNYFNHGVYSSGFTYFGYTMCSPLFSPVIMDESGKAKGIANNRLVAHHIGGKGNLSNHLEWKLYLTYSNNFGTYDKPYSPSKKQLMSLLELKYHSGISPIEISVAAGVDRGQLTGNRVGAMFRIVRSFTK